jgi:hypothetical protein
MNVPTPMIPNTKVLEFCSKVVSSLSADIMSGSRLTFQQIQTLIDTTGGSS